MEHKASAKTERICRVAFYIALLIFAYGTLFPFYFDLKPDSLSNAWSKVRLLPYWDFHRGRIQSFPDMVSNVMLGVPVGFFGFLWLGRQRRQSVWKWGLIGLGLSSAVEIFQLAIPYRYTSMTDTLNNGLGALIGAMVAKLAGSPILSLMMGTWGDPKRSRAFLLFCILVLLVLGPLDLTMDVSNIRSSIAALWNNPWGSGSPIADEWILVAVFAIFGATAYGLVLAGKSPFRISPAKGIAIILALPWATELGQFFVSSRTPSLREPLMGFLAAGIGILVIRFASHLATPPWGLLLITTSLIAAGTSPYEFVSNNSRFQWIPFLEYYLHTTPAALYDASIGLLSFALFAALFRASWGASRTVPIGAAIFVAVFIEFLQMYLPTRHSGTTDIAIAAFGALIGDVVESNLEIAALDASGTPPVDATSSGKR
jgi:VanZ family protein